MSSMKYNSIESQETLCARLPAKVLDLKSVGAVSKPFIISMHTYSWRLLFPRII